MDTGRIRFWVGLGCRLALVALAVVAASWAGHWLEERMALQLQAEREPMLRRAMVVALVAYVVLLALPFVPGVEIGLTLLALFGAPIAPVVYGATVLALLLSFLLGRLFPQEAAARMLDGLRLRRAATFVRGLEARPREERLAVLLRAASSRVGPVLIRHRHLALAVALNLPGNAVVGGGGGIGFAAGVSRLFGIADYMLTVALAVAPVPLVVLLFGA